MKTCHLIALISVIASSVMAQGTVASSSIMGYTKVNLPPAQYILVGVNFSKNGADPTLKDIIGTNQLRAASNYAQADRVILWNK